MSKKRNLIKNQNSEREMLAKEWAMEENIDPLLFVWWKEKMTKSHYNEIKKKVYRPRGE